MDNAGFLFAAYAIVWALLFGYVLILFNRQKKLQKEIDSLRASLGQDKEE